jgi:multidrug resistance efflux pump
MTGIKVLAAVGMLALLVGVVLTQEPAAPKDKPKTQPTAEAPAKKPAVHKVQKKPFRVELTVKGILEPAEAAEVAYRTYPFINQPPSQGSVTIRQVAEHGSTVRKGDVLAAFDTRKLDQVIEHLETDLKVAEKAIAVEEQDQPLFQKSVPVELALAMRGQKEAEEDLKYFLEVARPQAEKEADFSLKSAAYYLEFAQEELRQLEKMYKANDLTEDTEKIILRRQRHQVEWATFELRAAEIQHDYLLKVTLPRKDKSLRDGLVKQNLLLEKAQKTLNPQAAQKQQNLAKMRHDRQKNLDRLAKLRADRDGLTVRAPMDGIVYHGKFHKGQWSLPGGQEGKLVVDGSVSPGEVFLTVVKSHPLAVRLQVEEKDVHLLKPGLEGKARVHFDPTRKVPAKLTKVTPIPAAPGKYEALVGLEVGPAGQALMPGMGCAVRFVPYVSKDAIAVPAGCVFEHEDKHFVTVVHKGKEEKREVNPGESEGGRTEILSGLREGEEILLEPEEKAALKGGSL